MQRSSTLLLALAMLSASAATSLAQNTGTADPDSAPAPPPTNYVQNQAAPIQRTVPNGFRAHNLGSGQSLETTDGTASARVMPGVLVRVGPNTAVRTISADASGTELRLEHGLANVSVFHPADSAQILVDLPGGQAALVKDGIYTFNADTNTVRVFKGEARAYSHQTNATDKGVKVKENHEVSFGSQPIRSVENDPNQARADLLPVPNYARYRSDDGGDYGYGGYPYYGYGYGFGPYDYWGWGYPYYGFGYGFYGGYGFRGGYGYRGGGYGGGGFHGGGGGGGFHGGGGGGHR
ncbi:hypothetical protein [Granulicella mallensis]|uniref:FecR protein domain-containing protein n=1 Tax=Granulicella mallensis TaxID=940614 RepID=A0A7W7ZS25_9BACT|nr:hypothetical protein [Granulicella mallensis]MBB5065125.1 hypothetical protein [Granulicella mallensis]